MGVQTNTGYLEDSYLSVPYAGGSATFNEGMQCNFVVDDTLVAKSQVNYLDNTPHTGMQVDIQITDFPLPTGMERRWSNIGQAECAGYLQGVGYLEQPYLADLVCAKLRMQVNFQKRLSVNMQATFVLYNVTNLRILCNFASRGNSAIGGTNAWGNTIGLGQNWRALKAGLPVTASGDFDESNLNTDIVEQVWRTETGSDDGINLDVDTEISQGVTIDTLAILNHNLTTSASVVVQGSNDSTFSTVNTDITLTVQEDNIYYIADTFPDDVSQQNRYWRFVINDVDNPDNFISIGTIVFGSGTIFQGECFVDRVIRTNRHFSDKVRTEGFTNVSNDRALKHGVKLQFRNLRFGDGNYARLVDIFHEARTSLKCLWIPMPRIPERFAIFGKLTALPSEEHNVKGDFNEDLDFVSFGIEVDESL